MLIASHSVLVLITDIATGWAKCRHANLPTFGRILPLSRRILPSCTGLMKFCFSGNFMCDRIIKNSTFLVTKWTLSSSKCAKTESVPSRLDRMTLLSIPRLLSAFGLIPFSRFEKVACLEIIITTLLSFLHFKFYFDSC